MNTGDWLCSLSSTCVCLFVLGNLWVKIDSLSHCLFEELDSCDSLPTHKLTSWLIVCSCKLCLCTFKLVRDLSSSKVLYSHMLMLYNKTDSDYMVWSSTQLLQRTIEFKYKAVFHYKNVPQFLERM